MEIKSMEHSTLKVPYEILNKKFRVAQKVLDREVDQIHNTSRDIEKIMRFQNQSPKTANILDLYNKMGYVVKRLQVLKRKTNESITDELNASLICKRKLDHLKSFAPLYYNSSEMWQASVDQWKRMRMDRIVLDHLLRRGYYETAEKLANRSDIRHLCNIDVFRTSFEVENDLLKYSTVKCIQWCNDNKSKLRKINSTIEFCLREQEFIELVRRNFRAEAVKYARKYFSSFDKVHLPEICKCMALLAYRSDTDIEPYKSLFNLKRWDGLVLKFRNENYRLFQLSTQSLLSVSIQAGLSALKTPQCYSSSGRNVNCPLCQKDFNSIAKHLPYSHCVHSRLICRITGLPLNEHNQPMMLPNGQIFGQNAISEITKDDGSIVCPVTNTKFMNPKVEKVFIM